MMRSNGSFLCVASAFVSGLLLGCLVASSSSANEPNWGQLKLRFVLDGEAPKPKSLEVIKDAKIIGKTVPDESLVVGPKGEIRNVVVYLLLIKGERPAIHPDFDKPGEKDKDVTVDIREARFEPHVVALRVGQSIVVVNNDPVGHYTRIPFDLSSLIPSSKEPQRVLLDAARDEPGRLNSPIYPWMSGWVVMQDHPYMAISDAKGIAEIRNLPTGKHAFQVWHESYKKISAGEPGYRIRDGKLNVELRPGLNDLGDYNLPLPKE